MEQSLIPAPRFKYSLGWAATVVDAVVAKYPRATDLICWAYGITRYDLVKYVAKPDPLWNYFRSRIKNVSKFEERRGRPIDHETLVKWELDLTTTKHAMGEGGRLDKRIREQYNKRAGIKGRGIEATAEIALPSFTPPVPPSEDPSQFYYDFAGGI